MISLLPFCISLPLRIAHNSDDEVEKGAGYDRQRARFVLKKRQYADDDGV